ncbi:glycosaminoglycan xylosylkinase homolog [Culex pipiens pallens]|uniref:glycosaminoglycan xylosylkinase homolog n=1 Tax=Culex pipiens pallens TaxID=42434 RepID=UPI0019540C08|nr:glycosaminoglycan xylosylkinase homolog [Culex pipiens pallens]
MTKRHRLYLLLTLVALLVLLIFSTNFYFIRWLAVDQEHPVPAQVHSRSLVPAVNESDALMKVVGRTASIQQLVETRVVKLKTVFKNRNPRYDPVKRGLVRSFGAKGYNISTVWKIASGWPSGNEIFPQKDEKIGKVIRALQEAQILRARNTPRGTQLKLVFDLAGKQSVLFKPSWYGRDARLEGPVYSGKDRHNSEVVAFHLGAILNLRWTPIVVGRKVSLTEIYAIADDELRATMIKNDTRQCVYGKCHYCRQSETVCDDSEGGTLEGALLLIIPGKFAKYRSPWQRTYQNGVSAEWERNDGYCAKVKEQLPLERLLDLIDAAVFDFLIQNGDRHHYETREDRVLLMDNGKGFGNAFKDHFDILAPLYQCCMIRRTTWERLLMFSGGALTETLRELNQIDLLNPLLTKEHYIGLERRLLLIYATVELCREKYGSKILK